VTFKSLVGSTGYWLGPEVGFTFRVTSLDWLKEGRESKIWDRWGLAEEKGKSQLRQESTSMFTHSDSGVVKRGVGKKSAITCRRQTAGEVTKHLLKGELIMWG